MKQTPLYPLYGQYGAKTIDFGGWDLPVQFSGIMEEHETVRTKAGLFDVSHMGEFDVTGPDAEMFLQQMTTNDVSKLIDGKAQYSLMCYPDGGVVDDLLVYRLGEARYMLVVNAANIDKDLDWLNKHIEGNVAIRNRSDEIALLALQGPEAAPIMSALTSDPVQTLKPFSFIEKASVAGIEALVSRTGYTGEDGFELYAKNEDAPLLWERILEAGESYGLKPVGLGARDTLRFEARLPLYGQELSATISPLEAGLQPFVKLGKDEFIGRAALAAQKETGIPRKLVGIEMIDRGIPRSHYPVLDETGIQIGEVTTGTHSPTLKKNVGLALLNREFGESDTEVWIEIRGKKLRAKVVPTPFYRKASV